MPPKRNTKQKEIDSPTPLKTSKKSETHAQLKSGKQRTAKPTQDKYDQDELGIGSDEWSPVRRSPRHLSNKDVLMDKAKPGRKKATKTTIFESPELPKRKVQPKPRKVQKAETKAESGDEIEDTKTKEKAQNKIVPKKNLPGTSKSKISNSSKPSPTIAPSHYESATESENDIEEEKQPRTRGAKKRTSISSEVSPPTKRTKTRGNTKTPESPAADISVSPTLDESPSIRKSYRATRSSPPSKRINGNRTTATAVPETDSKKVEELNVAKTQLKELTKKYEELKRVGIQDAEKTFSEYKNNAEKRFEASDNAIQRLREELARFKEQKSLKKQLENQKLLEEQAAELESLKNQLEKLNAENEKSNGQTTAQSNPDLDLSLQLYQELSQLIIVKIEKTDQEIVFECEQSGGKGTLRYLLRQDLDDLETYHYEPLLDEEEDADLIEQIPGYFNEAISFKKSYASLFFWRALDSLKKEAKKH